VLPELRADDWFETNPDYETALEQLAETTDTVATRGAQVARADDVRTVTEEGFERAETRVDVPQTLDRVGEEIESLLRDNQPTE
jgi:sn-glycerol 3-phosphate transport system substrate-binding protein